MSLYSAWITKTIKTVAGALTCARNPHYFLSFRIYPIPLNQHPPTPLIRAHSHDSRFPLSKTTFADPPSPATASDSKLKIFLSAIFLSLYAPACQTFKVHQLPQISRFRPFAFSRSPLPKNYFPLPFSDLQKINSFPNNDLRLKIENPKRYFLQLGHLLCYIHV
jgi:hypothetical protein